MARSIASTDGTLYVVATPIGHQEDITLRARDVLREVDLIAAEDTRHSRPFLTALGVKTTVVSLHAHNEATHSVRLLEALKQGKNIALISDAGTPLIRDPGYPLVAMAQEAGIIVVPVPGACALIAALSAAGVPSEVFTFGGFLPATQTARCEALRAFAVFSHTLVFYESTHRLLACLADIATVMGREKKLVLAKELTKTFEAFVHGTVDEVEAWILAEPARKKGEFVLIIPAEEQAADTTEDMRCLDILLKELPLKQAVKLAAQITGMNKNTLYKEALHRQESRE